MNQGLPSLISELCYTFHKDYPDIALKKLRRTSYEQLFTHITSCGNIDGEMQSDPFLLVCTKFTEIMKQRPCCNAYEKERFNQCIQNLRMLHKNDLHKENLHTVIQFLYHLACVTQNLNEIIHKECGTFEDIFQKKTDLYAKLTKLNIQPNVEINSVFCWNQFHQIPQQCSDYKKPASLFKPPTQLPQDISPFYISPISNDVVQLWDLFNISPLDNNRRLTVLTPAQDEGFVTPGSQFSEEEEVKEMENVSKKVTLMKGKKKLKHTEPYTIRKYLEENDISNFSCKVRINFQYPGQYSPPRDVPFVCEVPQGIHHLQRILLTNNLDENLFIPNFKLSTSQLINDIEYLLMGVQSGTFFINKERNTFYMRNGIYIDTWTPELLHNYCEIFISCANHYLALKKFVHDGLQKDLSNRLIFQTFCKCLSHILKMYECQIAKFAWNHCILTALESFVTPLFYKLGFLTNFCFIEVGNKTHSEILCNGVVLLNYIYGYFYKTAAADDLSCLLYYIFECCCNVYFALLSQWLFEGKSEERFNEFFIKIDYNNTGYKDKRWLKSFNIQPDLIPEFVKEFSHNIFSCGKYVNLLQICPPDKMCSIQLLRGYPSITCCLDEMQIGRVETQWQQFEHKCHAIDSTLLNIGDILKGKTYSSKYYENIKCLRQEWFNKYEKQRDEQFTRQRIEVRCLQEKRRLSIEQDIQTKLEYAAKELDESKKLEEKISNIERAEADNIEAQKKQLIDMYQKANKDVEMRTKCAELEIARLNLTDKQNKLLPKQYCKIEEKPQNNKEKRMCGLSHDIADTDTVSEDGSVKWSEAENKYISSDSGIGRLSAIDKIDIGDGSNFKKPNNQCGFVYNERFGEGDSANKVEDKDIDQCTNVLEYITPSLAVEERGKLSAIEKMATGDGNHFRKPNNQSQYITQPSLIIEEIPKVNVLDSMSQKIQLDDNSLATLVDISDNILNENDTQDDLSLGYSLCESVKSTRPEAEYNKRKMMCTEYYLSNPDINLTNTDANKIIDSHLPGRTEALQNKLRVMTSEFNTPVCKLNSKYLLNTMEQINKRKIMSSSFDIPQCQKHSTQSSVLSDAEKNKQRVMSSEFGIVFNDKLENELKTEASTDNQLSINKDEILKTECGIEVVAEDSYDVENSTKSIASSPSVNTNVTAFTSTLCGDNTYISNIESEINCSTKSVGETKQEMDLSISAKSFFSIFRKPPKVDWPILDSDINIRTFDTSKTVDINNIHKYIRQSILIPLQTQFQLANDAILKLFIHQSNYLEHLIAFKDYFFLQKPEFSLCLTHELFSMVETVPNSSMLLNRSTLIRILQQALAPVPNASAKLLNSQFSLLCSDDVTSFFDLINPMVLDCLSLRCHIDWPLNIILTKDVLKDYNRVFKFFLQIHRVDYVLQRDFHSFRFLRNRSGRQCTQIMLYRYTMSHIVRIIRSYLAYDAIDSCWCDLVQEFTNSGITLDTLYKCHQQYLSKILERCLLSENALSCRELLSGLFSIILEYHEILRKGEWRTNKTVNLPYHSNYKLLSHTYGKFQKKLTDLRLSIKELVEEKHCQYLEPLSYNLASSLNLI